MTGLPSATAPHTARWGSSPSPWWRQDDAATRLTIHLRLTYSSSFHQALRDEYDELPQSTRSMLDATRGLEVERRARMRNLTQAIQRSCPLLAAHVDADDLRDLLSRWVDGEGFWNDTGRSLAESFCLDASPRLRSHGHGWSAELACLQGVVSGLRVDPTRASPWAHPIRRRDGIATESIACTELRVDPNGLLDLASRGHGTAVRIHIHVQRSDRKLTVTSESPR